MKKAKLKKLIQKKAQEKTVFLSRLSFHMTCLRYLTDRVKTGYSYSDIIGELAKIEADNKLEYLKVKLYEIMLMATETEKGRIFYNEDEISEKLFSLYQANNRYFKDYLKAFHNTTEKIRKDDRTKTCLNGQYNCDVRQSA